VTCELPGVLKGRRDAGGTGSGLQKHRHGRTPVWTR
jgi:hypothetical protein